MSQVQQGSERKVQRVLAPLRVRAGRVPVQSAQRRRDQGVRGDEEGKEEVAPSAPTGEPPGSPSNR